MSTPLGTLRYNPLKLNSKEIRLLHLYSASSLSAPLRCDLVHEELHPGLLYDALSYTWGSSARQRTILINGHEFPVTVSLWSSLCHIRSVKPRIIWVDAVCINQEDVSERNAQVVRMRDIYVYAKQVLIWLGPSAYESDLALNTLKAVVDLEASFMAGANSSLAERDLRTQLIQKLGSDSGILADSGENDAAPWIALGRLFRRAWWFRVWIIQEATCHNGTVFYCGTITISWDDFKNACSVLMDAGSETIAKYVLGYEGFGRFIRLIAFHAQRHNLKDQLDFLTVLSNFRTAEATNPRDKVYAGVGLMKPSIQKRIVVNYDNTIVKVYTDAASVFVDATNTLDILAHCEVDTGMSGLPTWVPDWNIWTGIEILTHRFAEKLPGEEGCDEIYGPLYQCARKSRAHAEFPPNKSTMILTGSIFDRLVSVSSPHVDLDDAPDALPDQSWRLFATSHFQDPTYLTGEPTDTAIRRTFVADKMCGLLGIAKKRGFAVVWPEHRAQEPQDIRSHIETSLSVATFQRAFAVTEHGYMGLVSKTACAGDVVCLLEGGQTPFIMRCNSPHREQDQDAFFSMVGETYIHGIMDGESWPPDKTRSFSIV